MSFVAIVIDQGFIDKLPDNTSDPIMCPTGHRTMLLVDYVNNVIEFFDSCECDIFIVNLIKNYFLKSKYHFVYDNTVVQKKHTQWSISCAYLSYLYAVKRRNIIFNTTWCIQLDQYMDMIWNIKCDMIQSMYRPARQIKYYDPKFGQLPGYK